MECFAHGLSHVFSTLTRQLGISLLLKFSQPRFFYLLHQNVEGRLCLISKGHSRLINIIYNVQIYHYTKHIRSHYHNELHTSTRF